MGWNGGDGRAELIQVDDVETVFAGSCQLFAGLFAFFSDPCLLMLVDDLGLSDLLLRDLVVAVDASQIIDGEALLGKSSVQHLLPF